MENTMKNILLLSLFSLFFSGCQQAPFIPVATPDELAPYYGIPQPATAIVNGTEYESKIGTTRWIRESFSDGTRVVEIGDAFAINTPTKPIVTTSNDTFILKLPIPINPTELWYAIYTVTEDEIDSQDSSQGVFRWNPDYETQTYQKQTHLSLLVEQELTLSLDSGFYVFEVNAGWGGTPSHSDLKADYGFLIKIQK
jgi:hypothetical protein